MQLRLQRDNQYECRFRLNHSHSGTRDGGIMMMNNKLWKMNAATMLAFLSILATFCMAKDKPAQSGTQRVSVIAHLPIEGAPVTQLSVQEEGGKQYLYVRQASQSAYTIVDVSHANKPKIVKRDTSQLGSGQRLQMIGGGIALSETPDSAGTGGVRHELAPAKAPAANSPQSLRVLDMSDPANPKTLQTFEGVTSVLADASRDLIYIANSEGVWILRHVQGRPPRPRCDSESVFSPIADCQ